MIMVNANHRTAFIDFSQLSRKYYFKLRDIGEIDLISVVGISVPAQIGK
jgi:hypothetical protein